MGKTAIMEGSTVICVQFILTIFYLFHYIVQLNIIGVLYKLLWFSASFCKLFIEITKQAV